MSSLGAWVGRQIRGADDGKGFIVGEDVESPAAGTGLAAMRERATLLGGKVSIVSKPGHGTSVELIVPLAGNRHV